MERIPIYRITDQRYEAEAFSGKGGLLAGGRWHERGRLVVYAARTSSLALLEWRVHTRALPLERTFVLIEATLPAEAVVVLDPSRLPGDWQRTPPPPSTRRLGEAFLEEGTALALEVPSVVNALERNVVINPLQAAAGEIHVERVAVLRPDPRLF